MKKFLAAAVLMMASVFAVSSVQAADVDLKDPYKMVTAVADNAFQKLKANKDKISDVKFRKDLVRNDLLPYVDTRYAGFKVMGTNLKKASAAERDAFVDAFAEYIVASFAEALAMYNNQDLVAPEYKKVSDSATQVNAKFLIREAGKKDLELVFKLRKNTKTGEWRAFDLVSEGISMLTAKENELSPLIRERGIKAVTDLINKHNQTGSTEAIK
ncbi:MULTISPECIES: ABC transporter substrate-binding protein [unclassified Anaerobiospirillum]|uniref:ABC transporter substrate-binding protein n=1 Tax=unclassified Anaerobiospirillum TaxID=2647410 RepID=UPI001FF5D674|nr:MULTISPECIES: ABC transporter substrate-binding protein [unclassified Anaerobiospirillum]MCK0525454.1 ABC transporter substrate-binding protein [Anaerobiospirillum sp. NML120449]MCK0534130.1 ABC transporter substrate-binding protein [Anaerobiospirillum sp. NML120511]MCK0539326.1 ABC transporter substrate-binding protein [Anaerobiospirillum sp. NML02-A-032]